MTIAVQATGKQWLVASQSKTDTMYIVIRTDWGYSCDCPDYFHRRNERGETCKHIDGVIAQQSSKLTPAMRSWGLSALTGGRQS